MHEDPDDIRNWQRRPDGITTSGKLVSGDVARLAALGVRHVINLALDDHPEALANEEALLAERGIEYSHIPVPFDAPKLEHFEAMREVLAHGARPAHVHCIMNYRVTAFFYLLDLAEGLPEPMAHARMREIWDPLASDDPRVEPWKLLLF